MIGLDTETEPFIQKVRGPRDVKLWGTSVCCGAESFYTEDPSRFVPFLSSSESKVGHNLKFDLGVWNRSGYEVNGRQDDTYLMAVLDDENRKNSLKSLAASFLGGEVLEYKELIKTIAAADRVKAKDVTEEVLRHHPIFAEYARKDAVYPKQLFPILKTRLENQGLWSVYDEIERPLLHVVKRMEDRGIRLNVPLLRQLKTEWEELLKTKKKFVYLHTGYDGFDIHNNNHLVDVLYDKLKIPCPKLTEKGQRSVDKQALCKIQNLHPSVAAITGYKELFKLLTSYVYPLLEYGENNEVLHPVFNQMGADTGRGSGGKDKQEGGIKSGYDTSIQTIPIRNEYGKRLREVFIPREGFRLVSADYSQQELRVLAHFSGDEKMIEAFQKGADIHEQTAKFAGCSRDVAKTVNFAYVYGSGAQNIADVTHISLEEAKRFMRGYRTTYRKVPVFAATVKHFAKVNGYVLTAHNRRRRFPNINDPVYGWMDERAAVNTVIQGTSAEITKLAMLAVDKHFGSDSGMMAQVHDEILFEVPVGREDEYMPEIQREMENVMKLKVPLKVSVKCGNSWAACK